VNGKIPRVSALPRPTRRTAIAAFVGAGIGAACGGPGARSSSRLEDAAEQYVRITLRVAQHQPSLVEAWNGPREWLPGPRQPVATIRDALGTLTTRLRELDAKTRQSPRCVYLTGQVRALDVSVRRLSGESMTFGDEARAALAIAPSLWRVAVEVVPEIRAGLDRALSGPGALHERVNTLRRRYALEDAGIERAFTVAIRACRDRTARWVPVQAAERVTLVRAPAVGAEARAIWMGDRHTELRLDDRATPDLAHLVWLAAHETYAGHHLQHLLAVSGSETQSAPIERQLQPAFGPHQLYSEGAAEAGTALLLDGSAFNEMCEQVCRAADVPAAGLPELIAIHRAQLALDLVIVQVAEAYLDGRVGQAKALERLETEGLIADAASFLSTIERQRTRLLAYPVGRRLVTAALGTGPMETRWDRLLQVAATLTMAQNLP
jgi:hypothetical protein